jgi:hypothetical protein
VTVKVPLLRNFFRSLCVIPASRLRSSFSIAIFRQRPWNSHSAQCRFRTRSGGVRLPRSVVIASRCFCTSPDMAEVLTALVAWSSPWMILPRLTSLPSTWDKISASNASSSLSSLPSLLVKMKRMGMNCAGLPLPSEGMRSTAWR